MLLTGSQISAALSSGVVCIFTSILFLSGYALQQKTVHNIHDLIHPKIELAPPPIEQLPTIADRKQQVLAAHGSPQMNWKRMAYARSVQGFSEVCETVMLFAELTAQRSRAQKVILYPWEWEDMDRNQHGGSPALDTAMRLLRQASRSYHVALIPVKEAYGYHGPRDRTADLLANLLALVSFERVMYLPPRGMVLDAEILDSLFGVPLNASVTALDGSHAKPFQSLMIRPSISLSKRPAVANEHLAGPVLNSSPLSTVILPTSYLREVPASANLSIDAQTVYETTGYLRFTDSDILGPEFDLQKGTFARAQPEDPDLQVTWRNAYDHFRLMRMNYCGLDLQPIVNDAALQEL